MTITIKKPFHGQFPVSQEFGAELDWYIKVMGYPHNGIDYAMPIGTAVLTCDEGTVAYADNVPDSDGCGINIVHKWGMSQYWHLNKLLVKYGEKVTRGQYIGDSGKTGWATGPHLHFGIKVNGYGLPDMRGWCNPGIYYEVVAEPTPSVPVVNKTYIVGFGDSLWKIATKFYGKGYMWPKIYEVNKDQISNPNVIKPFQVLRIP